MEPADFASGATSRERGRSEGARDNRGSSHWLVQPNCTVSLGPSLTCCWQRRAEPRRSVRRVAFADRDQVGRPPMAIRLLVWPPVGRVGNKETTATCDHTAGKK